MNPQVATPLPNTASDQYAALKSAVLGAQVNTAPGGSPLGSFPELSKLYSSAPQVEQAHLKDSGGSYNTGVTADNQASAAAAAKSAAATQLKGLTDPSTFKQIQKSDGGYAFYDGNGNEISASQYASAKNLSPTDVLKNSQNPVDKAFIQDYNQLQNYINDKNNSKNDPAAKSAAQAVETQVRKSYGIDLHQQNPSEVINAFMQAYPTVFGNTAAGKQGSAPLLPDVNARKATIKATIKTAGKSSVSSHPL